MKLAIMQPYFFPYIGYFQLVSAVDRFVFYDDVNFIKGGWINRNRIIINGEAKYFNLVMRDASSFKLINSIELDASIEWKKKLLRKLEINYSKAPFFNEVFEIICSIISSSSKLLCDVSKNSVMEICHYLKIKTEFIDSSSIYKNANLKSTSRVIDICKRNNATCYINLIGGLELYDRVEFGTNEIDLKFLLTDNISYNQFTNCFIPSLSIIDVLMFNSVDDIKIMMKRFTLI